MGTLSVMSRVRARLSENDQMWNIDTGAEWIRAEYYIAQCARLFVGWHIARVAECSLACARCRWPLCNLSSL